MIRILIRAAAAAVTLLAGMALVPVGSSSASPVTASQSGSDTITVQGQSPWVSSGKTFQLRLQVKATDPAHTAVGVLIFPRLTTRTAFDNDLTGNVDAYAWYQPSIVALSNLPADPQGGVDVNLPVNTPAASGGAFPEVPVTDESGVFPLQVGLYTTSGKPIGTPVTTFLVFAQGPPTVTGYPRLSVAVVLPFHAAPNIDSKGQVQPATTSQSRSLGRLVNVLAQHTDVPITLGVTPQTLDALANGDATARSTLSGLQDTVRKSSDQILPATYTSLSMNDMQSAGLAAEVTNQLQRGNQVLADRLGKTPASTSWVINGPVDPDVLTDLIARGATEIIVPDGDLSRFPPAAQLYTFAYPTRLTGPGVPAGAKVNAFAADAGLTADFNNAGGPVLAASQLLAEMAMIQVETPSYTRGVAVVPPAGWVENPTFINTLLAGLEGHPLLQAVTTSGLFAKVSAPSTGPVERSLAPSGAQAAATSGSGSTPGSPSGSPSGSGSGASSGSGSTPGSTPGSSSVAPSTTVPRAVPGSGSPIGSAASAPGGAVNAVLILTARQQINALAGFAPTEQSTVQSLQLQLLVSESNDLTVAQRNVMYGDISRSTGKLFNAVALPRSSSITLTSTQGEIPLTILSSTPLHVRVRLQLSSERLFFHAFNPPNGHCTVPASGTAVCDITLTTHNTTLKVPVETRSSGVFPLNVALETPDGSQPLASESDTVRSTAVSDVGIILIVLTVVSLAIWWVRDLRHGRRARQLVPAPTDDEDAAEDGTVVDLNDPVVNGFFATPPPEFDQPESLQRRP